MDAAWLQQEIDRYGANQTWHRYIRNGPEACTEAARDMIRLLVALADSGTTTYLSVSNSPLGATYVLAIYICCQPRSLLSWSHFEVCDHIAIWKSVGNFIL